MERLNIFVILVIVMKNLFPLLILVCAGTYAHAQKMITINASQHSFPLPEVIYVDQQDDWLVGKVAQLLRGDMEAVMGRELKVLYGIDDAERPDSLQAITDRPAALKSSLSPSPCIIIGTLRSSFVQQLQLDTTGLSGKWEAFRITASHGRIVILGSDKRGAAYGALELSRQLGVSPWYWWADVPVKKRNRVYVREGRYDFGPPAVQYRGIFINDEAPAFSGWTHEKFGGFNHLVYEKVFELLLRLRGNYLWPAMWGNAFNDDDTLNPVLADKWGIVMGTSHHEPMLRAQAEWKRYGKGAWDYVTNDSVLRDFWRKGIEHMGKHESIVTVGMRGDGDLPMSNETATELLTRIVKDQREIIREVTGRPAEETPQMWALYKEVQDYYDKGMRVPEDVTLLLCDDNWGNIRRLPGHLEKNRKGGFGIYYHFDYVGDPRNYKWVNTNNLARVWEQLHLAKMYGADKVWIVNVGDLKPMELPITFFMDYAWAAGDTMRDGYREFARENFGEEVIGDYLREYSEMAARRKPELLDEYSYSLKQYKEIVAEWSVLDKKVVSKGKMRALLEGRSPSSSAAYFQLVQYPVAAMYNLHKLYYAVALYKSDRIRNKAWADSARKYYLQDSLLTIAYHRLENGKWNHMMDQTHIGYTGWQQPEVNRMPDLLGAYMPKVFPDIYKSIPATGYVGKWGKWRVIRGIGKFGDGVTCFEVDKAEGMEEAEKMETREKADKTETIDKTDRHQMINKTDKTDKMDRSEKINKTDKTDKTEPNNKLDYEFQATGNTNIYLNFSPTLNFTHGKGLTIAVSIDGGEKIEVAINENENDKKVWEEWVANNIIQIKISHVFKPGKHHLVYTQRSPGIVFQGIELEKK